MAARARSKGLQEGEVTGQLFGRLAPTLMQGNALMLSSRFQENSLVPSQVDGVMRLLIILSLKHFHTFSFHWSCTLLRNLWKREVGAKMCRQRGLPSI